MEFRIRKDAREWFKYIRNELTAPPGTPSAPDFDAFYFCFIAGIAKKRKDNATSRETAELVEHFPGPYRVRGRLLVGLFLSRELEYLGVTLTEKQAVHTEISRLVQPEATNFLSDEGVREFNKYSHGGYEVLLDWFEDKPRALETFIRAFRQKVGEALAETTSGPSHRSF